MTPLPAMSRVFLLLAGAAALLVPATAQNLIFEEEWNTLDYDLWQHERTMSGGGNWEFQIYDNNRSSSWVDGGILYIKPGLTTDRYGSDNFVTSGAVNLWGGSDANFCTQNEWWGCERSGSPSNGLNPVTSARIRSSRGFTVKNTAYVEVRAKMPKGDWLWPAIWMLPEWEEYGGWPASGEIDLVESRGNSDLVDEFGNPVGNTHAGQTLHWGPYWDRNRWEMTNGWKIDDFADSFHLYQLEWELDHLTMYIDNNMTFTLTPPAGGMFEFGGFENTLDNPWQYGTTMAPFDRKFYFIMNVAVGGTNGFFQDSWINGNGPKPWANDASNAFGDFWDGRADWMPTWDFIGNESALAVDYIRVWDASPYKN